MMIHSLCGPPPNSLASALERFESEFTYPLGPGRSFRISHGEDYPRFFRAMGEARCFVAERNGVVLGTIGVALRPLWLPSGEECTAVYLGDLKLTAHARQGRALLRLAEVVQQWVGGRTQAAFAVVMDGTRATPTRYTGRLGIPQLGDLAKVIVLRIATGGTDLKCNATATADEAGTACYRQLSMGRYACPGGTCAERSAITPHWLTLSGDRACGRLEDTRRAKRLIADDGQEMPSAHLSCFAYRDPASAVELAQAARVTAASLGFPALFVAVPPADADTIRRGLGSTEVVAAPATIYGTGLEAGRLWNINTAEI